MAKQLVVERRYDLDWLRVCSIGLLLVYHAAIAFQPWGRFLGFITSNQSWEAVWVPMTMLNIWRIPLLFFVAGMAVYYAICRRSWKAFLAERCRRIVLPYCTGIFLVVPLQCFLVQRYYGIALEYQAQPAHCWFLGNLLVYMLLLLPIFYGIKKKAIADRIQALNTRFNRWLFILAMLIVVWIEIEWINPPIFELYAFTMHGFFLGFLAFVFGYIMGLIGIPLWQDLSKAWWLILLLAFCLYSNRVQHFPGKIGPLFWALESFSWILALLGVGYRYLNRPGKHLAYLGKAALPVYIIHLFMQFLASILVLSLPLASWLQYLLVVVLTASFSLGCYEYLIRRFAFTRLLFGVNSKN
ncbi:acyltransferase family protein [Flavihumibacter sp. CACIAM 22H1]|uniref:acyltransferase family protein n=1 Tax=Flavihumibacter sp. CACIAM 22H1 TaxID=1812911 RepID=UPI0007A83C8E|nr:acyltransferase family protein [Flavihumibacter sp. CACIAM 22H1]KYP13640.1 MAG: hypothetical protein A1D16_17915 [Flavihumibacter sp. CACIAM 22H1]